MAEDIAIKVSGVSKTFKLPQEKNTSIKSVFISKLRGKGKGGYEIQKALQDVSFEVKKGEFFGIVGKNGGGKSTLLKLLAGIYSPTTGEVTINGRLTPFIELGVGFNHELTGRENVFLNGALLGFNRKEMNGLYQTIVDFAELEEFMDQKLKNYSSGMLVRLAFSIAIRAHSEIVVMDEVLAVGDAAFQKKCFDVFRDLKKQGRTIILVTHDMANIERFCDRALVIDKGKVIDLTSPAKAASLYARLNAKTSDQSVEKKLQKSENRWGTGEIKVKKLELSQTGAKEKNVFEFGGNFKLEVELERMPNFKKSPIVCGLAIANQDGVNIAGPNSLQGKTTITKDKFSFEIGSLHLAPGEYSLTVVIYDDEVIATYDFLDKFVKFFVVSDHTVHGMVELPDVSWRQS